MKRIICPSIGDALYLSTILEHEGYPAIWLLSEGKPLVATMAPMHAVKMAIDTFPGDRK